MTDAVRPLTPWQTVAAAGMEGVFFLAVLLWRLVDCGALLWALQSGTPVAYGRAAAVAVGGCAVLAPLRLGRWLWYLRWQDNPRTPPGWWRLVAGFRRFRAAVGWRWAVWWRQTGLFLLTALPGLLCWSWGDRLTRQGEATASLLWLILGAVALLGAAAVTGLRRCRYALAPLYVARGCSAPLAVHLSLRHTRRRTGAWLNFWGDRSGRLLLCLLPGAALWVCPRLWREYVALLSGWLGEASPEATRRLFP